REHARSSCSLRASPCAPCPPADGRSPPWDLSVAPRRLLPCATGARTGPVRRSGRGRPIASNARRRGTAARTVRTSARTGRTASCVPLPELDERGADRDAISVDELVRLDGLTVQTRPVRGTQIGDRVRATPVADLRVTSRRAIVRDRDLTLGRPPDGHGFRCQHDRPGLTVLV